MESRDDPCYLSALDGQLMGVAEIAAHLAESGRAVSRARASQYTHHPRFPRPVAALKQGKVWLRHEVVAFFRMERPAGRHLPPQQDGNGVQR